MLKRAKKSEPETSFSVLYFASVAQENAPPKSVVRAAQKGDKGKA